jgi:hypothetical protein
MPWAVLATIAFVVAFLFHLAGGSVEKYVLDAELIGLICLSAALWVPGVWAAAPWRRSGPPAAGA